MECCIPQVLDIKTKAKMMFNLTLSTTYEKRSTDIHVGDFISELVYQDRDNLKTVSGVVKSINVFERYLPKSMADDCNEYVALRNIVESITLDISERYKSSEVTVDIVSIRAYDMVMHNTMNIEYFDVINDNTIEFHTETRPIAFIWNDKVYNLEIVEDRDFTYRATVDAVCMINSAIIFDDSGSIFKRNIHGPDIDAVDDKVIRSSIFSIMNTLRTNYSELYTGEDITDIVGDIPYTPIIRNIGNIDIININGTDYDLIDSPSELLYFGNRDHSTFDTYIKCNLFKVIDKSLCICAPLAGHFTDDMGDMHINVNGYDHTFDIIPYKGNIHIGDIRTIGTPEGYNTITEYGDYDIPSITFTRNHRSSYVNFAYADNMGKFLTTDILSVAITNDSGWQYCYRIVPCDTLLIRDNIENIYIHRKYMSPEPVTVNDTNTINYKVFAPSRGYLVFDLHLVDKKK